MANAQQVLLNKKSRTQTDKEYIEVLVKNVVFLIEISNSYLKVADSSLKQGKVCLTTKEVERLKENAHVAAERNFKTYYNNFQYYRTDTAKIDQLQFDYQFHYIYRDIFVFIFSALEDSNVSKTLYEYEPKAVIAQWQKYTALFTNMMLDNIIISNEKHTIVSENNINQNIIESSKITLKSALFMKNATSEQMKAIYSACNFLLEIANDGDEQVKKFLTQLAENLETRQRFSNAELWHTDIRFHIFILIGEYASPWELNLLGRIYDEGMFEIERDSSQALKWYIKAAEGGFCNAQYNLGVIFETGDNVPADKNKAIIWYKRAALQGLKEAFDSLESLGIEKSVILNELEQLSEGDTKAKIALGNIYYEGKVVPKNYEKAENLLVVPAEQGNIDAQKSLGFTCLYNGKGVKAAYWFHKAAEQGDADSAKMIKNWKL